MTKSNGKGLSSGSNRLEKDAPIAIIGCGIASLSTAISLAQAGFSNISIFERDANYQSRREGFGLTLSYNPKGPLSDHHLGILEEVAQQDCPSRSHYIFRPNGTVCGYYGNAFLPRRGKGQRGNIRIARQMLQRIMTNRFMGLAHIATGTSNQKIFWGHELTDIREMGEGHEKKVEIMLKTSLSNPTTVISKKFDLVIAADGVRSSVVKCLAPQCQPEPLNVMLILGITDNFHHPLLTERGFYTINGEHRLFTMPYQGDRYTSERRIMWQLSYRYRDNKDDTTKESKDETDQDDMTFFLSQQRRNPDFLRDEAMKVCSQWHDPVPAMIRATPAETIWGTPLYDRQPRLLQKAFQPYSRIVVVGDALHACSPFKGQGANQSLLDGPLVADWLQRASVEAAVNGIWREAIQRTDKVVEASRLAAKFWHSPECLVDQESHIFAGVEGYAASTRLLSVLAERKITASLSEGLDDAIRDVIQELDIGSVPSNDGVHVSMKGDGMLNAKIMELASLGALSELRYLSLNHGLEMRFARDKDGRSSLHLAAKNGHFQTCRWLITEAFVDPRTLDLRGRSPLDVASDKSVLSFLQKVMRSPA